MVRRHRLIEAYLVRFLGYSWDAVHPEAERLEHAVSDTLVDEGEPERLRFLGELGLVPGVVVTVRERQPFGGPVTVEAAGERHTIGAELAHVVLCASGDTR
jgi:Fe2+ transport system protein FeoA